MKKTLLVLSTILTSIAYGQNCTDLFISEYVEGWSNNKALEIYNPTANTINLSNYFVARYSNGSTSATVSNAIQLIGTVAPYSVHVAVLEKLDPDGIDQEAPVWDSLQVRADEFYCPDYNTSDAFYWNGNDAILLAKGTLPVSPTANVNTSAGFAVVDVFGKLGENPGSGSDPLTGWTAEFPYVQTGDGVTVDHSMIRKNTIQKGVISPVSFFNPLGEWDSIPAVIVRLDSNGDTVFGGSGNPLLDGNWNSLGYHNCTCDPSASISAVNPSQELAIYPNPTNGVIYIKGTADVNKIQVYNSLGQRVKTIDNNGKTILSLDLGDLKGIYLLKMTDDSGVQITKRVIVK